MVFYLRGRWRVVCFLLGAIGLLTLVQVGLIRGAVAVVEMTSRHQTPIYAVERDDRALALTFDAAWASGQLEEILAVLEKERVSATFFLSGYFLERYPDLARRIASLGHEVGNATFTNPHLTSLSAVEIANEIAKNHTLIKSVTGQEAKVFRPPFGEYNDEVIGRARALGYQTVLWSVDSMDWRNPAVDLVADNLARDARPGAIVLLHIRGRNTASALAKALPVLKRKGLKPALLSDLLLTKDYYVEKDTGVQKLLPAARPQPEPRRRFWFTWPR
jgi:peptidoglycan/xylan/chitin deacetylase (PgdA/CDA1 family)